MTKLKVNAFAVSIDGYGAGPRQSLEDPLGVGGKSLHEWFFPTRTFKAMHGGGEGGSTGVDDDFARRSFDNTGAWILGRNMFGPVRGPWPDDQWKGWWGDNPPYHVPVFVLTHAATASAESAAGLLAMAQQMHDKHVADGEQQRDKIIAEAQIEASSLVNDAQEKSRKILGALEQQRSVLERKVEQLRGFERDYRSRLKAYIEGQLRDLDARGSVAAPEVEAN